MNDFDYPGGVKLFENTFPIAENILDLKKKARESKVPVIYVNDNFGKWQSDFKKIIGHLLTESQKGAEIVKLLEPDENDYFVLKPKHSGFYSKTLELLLEYLETETLILTGITTDLCILLTANDAYMRDYKIYVPQDCVAAIEKEDNKSILKFLEKNLDADIGSSVEINFENLLKVKAKKIKICRIRNY